MIGSAAPATRPLLDDAAAEALPVGGARRSVVVVLAVLLALTAAALLVTQRLKQAPALLRNVAVPAAFSPDGDGVADEAVITFSPGRRDRVGATVIDAGGRAVRKLRRERRGPLPQPFVFRWDGRTADGRPAPAGTYRVRVRLRRRDRTIVLRQPIRLERPAAPAPGRG